MKIILLISISFTLLCSCNVNDTKENKSFRIEPQRLRFSFDTYDIDSNILNVELTGTYELKETESNNQNWHNEPNRNNRLITPKLTTISKNILNQFSAGDIYNYKRKEIDDAIIENSKLSLDSNGIIIEKLYMVSVKLPVELKERLLNEHIQMQDSIKNVVKN